MRIKPLLLLFFILLSIAYEGHSQTLFSPDKKLTLRFMLDQGTPYYELKSGPITLIGKSQLGFKLDGLPDLTTNFVCIRHTTHTFNEQWQPVWGEEQTITNHYNELWVALQESTPQKRSLNIRFRLYNDGLGFRYEFPDQPSLTHFRIQEEQTAFNITEDAKAYWIPGDYDSNEFVYQISSLSALPDTLQKAKRDLTSTTLINDHSVQTPLLLKKANGWYLNIHEAALIDYPAMALTLSQTDGQYRFQSHLTPDPQGHKGRIQTPFQTPWRTIIATPDAKGILLSRLILNLNEPCKLATTDWIKPMKYMGIWWHMFVPNGKTWNYCDPRNLKIDQFDYQRATPNGRHGANTADVVKAIDFAARHRFDGLLIEGWNIGWEDWFDHQKEKVFDFVTPYPDFDLSTISRHAQQQHVGLIMHHETSGSIMNYERHMPEAYRLMNTYGYQCVKTGYVGRLLPAGEYHYGQTFVNHVLHTIEETAKRHIMINIHESAHPTGLHRTYPNFLACESARGTEYEAFAFNRPDHTTILPFTRLVGGPMDYTPGIFQLDFSAYDANCRKTLSSTLAKQLALYVVLYSPFQMAPDLPENYMKHPDAFQFIKDVPVDWKRTVVLEAEPGAFVTIARCDKHSNDWYVGCSVNAQARTSTIKLDFLDPKKSYMATLYKDHRKADYAKRPMLYTIEQKKVTSKSQLSIYCASGGGYAISLKEIKE